jgi:hypothetical protein
MPENKMFVLSAPPEGVDQTELHDWYDVHEAEVLELDGFRGAERFELAALRSPNGPPLPYTHLIAYEIEGSFEDAWQNLRDAVDGGQMQFPGWYPQLVSAGALGSRLGATAKESA